MIRAEWGDLMVPDKFNMVDMGGIDLIMMQGEAVPGLYDKLMAAISNCQYQCLYHWLFDGILIPPTYVQLTDNDGEVYLNEGVSVTSDDVIHIYSVAPGPVDPEIIPLLAEENGVYNVPSGKDGFNPVTVDVPSYTPVIEPITITENGTYNIPAGIDGYGPITVNVSLVFSFIVTVDGGYNGGAAVTVICETISEQLFSGTGSYPYNLQYTPNSASSTIGEHTVNITVPDLPTNTSDLVVQITFDGVTKSASFHHTGANTSYGYGHQTANLNFY